MSAREHFLTASGIATGGILIFYSQFCFGVDFANANEIPLYFALGGVMGHLVLAGSKYFSKGERK